MSLIIAIEPDRDQAAQLKDLVRRHTGAELILADSTAGAIDAIESHVPDLVLIPAFLSPEDDEALTNALRVTEAASHVQTLTIPVLGEPQQRSALGVLSRLRRDSRPASPDSCDPKLFAEQITEYLERVAKERGPIAGTNGKGSPGSNGGQRKAETAAAPTPPPADKAQAASVSKPATAPKVVSPAPPPEPPPAAPDIDLGALEVALTQVEFDGPLSDASVAAAETEPVGADDLDGLEQGLSSLMEKLAVEESKVPSAGRAAVNSVDWAELKQLESVEYAMPSIAPRDDNAAAANTAPPEASASAEPAAAAPAKPPAAKKSEFGDLIDSLKKDLGR